MPSFRVTRAATGTADEIIGGIALWLSYEQRVQSGAYIGLLVAIIQKRQHSERKGA
jgi:hypothetical protein